MRRTRRLRGIRGIRRTRRRRRPGGRVSKREEATVDVLGLLKGIMIREVVGPEDPRVSPEAQEDIAPQQETVRKFGVQACRRGGGLRGDDLEGAIIALRREGAAPDGLVSVLGDDHGHVQDERVPEVSVADFLRPGAGDLAGHGNSIGLVDSRAGPIRRAELLSC